MINKDIVKTKDFAFEIESKLNYELKKFLYYSEWTFAFYCYLTGALTMKLNHEELFENLKSPDYYSLEEIEYEEMLTCREIAEQYFKKLKKYHKYILSTMEKIDSYLYILLDDEQFCKKLETLKTTDFNKKCKIINLFYSHSLLKTIKNITLNCIKNFSKSEKIYHLYLNKKPYHEIIKEVYRAKYIWGNELNPLLVNRIHYDQNSLEHGMALIRFIVQLEKNDYLTWLKNTYDIMKKS